jgi:hypothetical protein
MRAPVAVRPNVVRPQGTTIFKWSTVLAEIGVSMSRALIVIGLDLGTVFPPILAV